jgi:hypothetical protein
MRCSVNRPARRARVGAGRARQSVAVLSILLLVSGCARSAYLQPRRTPVAVNGGERASSPRAVHRPDTDLDADSASSPVWSPIDREGVVLVGRQFLRLLTPLALTLSMAAGAPTGFVEQLDAQVQDRPIPRRRAPDGQRRDALAFVKTELFFGTAKAIGAVSADEFYQFLDDVVTPLFPDGFTLVAGEGQFRSASGAVIRESAFVLTLLYPVEGQKASSRNIDAIRKEYMRRHQQESVLRVDDPFLVWVSF